MQFQKSGIYSVQSRIQNYLGFDPLRGANQRVFILNKSEDTVLTSYNFQPAKYIRMKTRYYKTKMETQFWVPFDADYDCNKERNLYVLCFASREGIRILESGKFLLVESRILGFGILNTVQGNRNPTNDWNLESNDKESGIQFWNPESTVYKYNRVMDALGRFQPRPCTGRFSLQSQKRRRKRKLSRVSFFLNTH